MFAITESTSATFLLLLTASTEANAVIEAVAAGAASYLRKVADMDQVLTMMRDAATGEGRGASADSGGKTGRRQDSK